MKSTTVLAILFSLLFISCKKDKEIITVENSATYEVTYNFNWNSQDFPTHYPSNAHFSKLIGWTHATNNDFFQLGTLASEGIKQMAQSGKITPLDEEINHLITTEKGLQLIIGSNLGTGTGTIQVNATVNKENPAVTLATMLAPSPDWYAAVVNINLYESGAFVTEKTVNAYVYDAGTDSGTTYTSTDTVTNPQAAISLLVVPPIGDSTSALPIASVKFKKL